MIEHKDNFFGFWLYLMTDLVLFASLFAVYAVFRGSTFGGPGTEIFNTSFALMETLILLVSSFTCGIALLLARAGNRGGSIAFLITTLALGAAFVYFELSEFASFIAEGNGPSRSGFLSSYFTLVGTHGFHVTVGLVWMLALIIALIRRGFTHSTLRKLALLTLFWHFLDLVWIFIFTIVYLFGI
jgi:cytochrome o ubiquinol oxidase subunit 3